MTACLVYLKSRLVIPMPQQKDDHSDAALGVEVDDVLEIAEKIDVRSAGQSCRALAVTFSGRVRAKCGLPSLTLGTRY